ncbi:MAG: hypothetical protein LBG65_00675 [Puniceicoccales bacterium]|jgi:hypothetical protein|nr:hypothetical protein [Puniceicoccales bacterium]
MKPCRRFLDNITPLFLAALLVAFVFPFLSGCSKTHRAQARVARDDGAGIEKRMESVEALAAAGDQALLADVAANTGDPQVRHAAMEKISDERFLAKALKNMRGGEVGLMDQVMRNGPASRAQEAMRNVSGLDAKTIEAALGKITDPRLLTDLARHAASLTVRMSAVVKTGDQAALAALVRDNSLGIPFRQAIVGELTDQAVLADIAKNAADSLIREAAAGKLTDQVALTDIAQDAAGDSALRKAAVGRLTDQALLATIAKDAKNNSEIREQAVRTLTDQGALAGIVMAGASLSPDNEEHTLALLAVESMTDQARLAAFAGNDKLFLIRDTIVGKLTDQKLLEKFATDAGEMQPVRYAAVQNLVDARVLAGIARTDEDGEVRKLALSKLSRDEPSLLVDIIQNAGGAKGTQAAVGALEKLDDQRLLAGVAATATLRIIREEAIDKITDQAALSALARHDGADVRLLALWRLADKALLADIAKNDADGRVRQAAAAKLSTAPAARAEKAITDLIKEGKVAVAARGSSISKLSVTLKRMTPYPLEVQIPAGTYFFCDNSAAQNMVSTADVTLTLHGDSQSTEIPVACANQPRDIPGEHDSFVIGIPKNAGELSKLMAVLGKKNVPYHTKQAAVWIVTDDADYGGLGSLRSVSRFTPRIPGVAHGTRSIKEPEAAEAMRLCDEAGIDIKSGRIWRDREKILAELKPGELKNWLADFIKP